MSQDQRYLFKPIVTDLSEKIVMLGGPRQVGKTTLSLQILSKLLSIDYSEDLHEHPAYLNWDILSSRALIKKGELPSLQKLIILDEIHKFANWRNLVKGFYDQYRKRKSFLITGSARLDFFRKGGDSLLGRSHYFRLHPLSLNELGTKPTESDLRQLVKFGGFPEPFFKGNEVHWRRWQIERNSKILNEDLLDLEKVKDISLLELLLDALPNKVGSPLSINSLREDLNLSHETVERYVKIFENLYLVFRISPYGAPKIRAVKKEQKLYFWDWSQLTSEGTRFENLVASQLLKYCHFQQDTLGYKMELRYLRDTDGREIDFVVQRDKKPLFAVEVKLGDSNISSNITYFKQRTKIPKFYQVHMGSKDFGDAEITGRVLPFITFCSELELP